MSRSFALFARGFSQEDHTTRLAKNLLASHESPVAPYQPPVPPADDVPRPPKRPQSANAAKRKVQSSSNARPKTPAKGAVGAGNAKEHPNLHQQLYKEHKEKMKQTAPEDLANELFELKKKMLGLEETISFLKGENHRLETEGIKQQRRIDQLMTLSDGVKATSAQSQQTLRKEIEKSILVRQLKNQITAMKGIIAEKDQEIESLRRDIRTSHLKEIENERDEYFQEIQRLVKVTESLKDDLQRERQRREWSSKLAGETGEDLKKELARLASGYQHILANLQNKGNVAATMPPSSNSNTPARPSSAGSSRPPVASGRTSFITAGGTSDLPTKIKRPQSASSVASNRSNNTTTAQSVANSTAEAGANALNLKPVSLQQALEQEQKQPPDSIDLLDAFKPDGYVNPAIVKSNVKTTQESGVAANPKYNLEIGSLEEVEPMKPKKEERNDVKHEEQDRDKDDAEEEEERMLEDAYSTDWNDNMSSSTKRTSKLPAEPNLEVVTVSSPVKQQPFYAQQYMVPPQGYIQQTPPPLQSQQQPVATPLQYANALFRMGEKIQAQYGDGATWYDGLIRGVHSDDNGETIFYEIGYSDGGYEKKVAQHKVRKPVKASTTASTQSNTAASASSSQSPVQSTLPPSTFKVGDKIEALYYKGTTWYKGEIRVVTVNPMTRNSYVYDIRYEDSEMEKQVLESNIRNIINTVTTSPPTVASVEHPAVKKVEEHVSSSTNKTPAASSAENVKESPRAVPASTAVSSAPIPVAPVVASPAPSVPTLTNGSANSSLSGSPRSTQSQTTSNPVFRRGDKVEAYFEQFQAWYPGKIVQLNGDGTFAIEYDDGDVEAKVPTTRMRIFEVKKPSTGWYQEGDLVKGRFQQGAAWFSAKVTGRQMDPSTGRYVYSLRYDDGDIETNVRDEFIVLVEESPRSSSSVAPDNKASSPPVAVSAPAATAQATVESKYKVGDKVEGQYGGSAWFAATVTAVHGGNGNASISYDLLYDDGDREDKLPENRLRPRSSTAPALAPASVVSAPATVAATASTPKVSPRASETNNSTGSGSSSLFASPRSSPRVETKFKIGDKVEGHYNSSAWYAATVKSVKVVDGKAMYGLLYDDGDVEDGLMESRLRLKQTPSTNSPTPAAGSPRVASTAASPRSTKYQKGDKVQANYGGKGAWFDGHITAVTGDGANATYDIEYEDGDSEKAVKEALVRVPPPQLSEYNVGDMVEGNYQGNGAWYGGKIKGKQGGGYEILYDDGEEERGVSVKNIRLIKAAASVESSLAIASAPSPVAKESPRPEPTLQPAPQIPATIPALQPKFKIGDKIEGFYGESAWYPATVQAIRNDAGNREVLYDLLYDDGDKEQSVKESCLRMKSTPAASTSVEPVAEPAKPAISVPSTSNISSPRSTRFQKGDKVQANYGGKGAWFDGRVTAVNCDGANATYDIEYEDGDSEKAVKEALVRVPPPQLSEYNVGDVVEGNYQGNGAWYGGKIKGKQGGGYEILYDDGEEERGVSVKNIRLIKAAASVESSLAIASAPSPVAKESPRPEPTLQPAPQIPATIPALQPKFKIGDKIEGFYGESAWYPATVQAIRNDAGNREVLYDLLYDDGDKEQSVKESCLRMKSTPAASTSVEPVAEPAKPAISVPSTSNISSPRSTRFQKGDKVQANYGGKGAWFDGRVTAVNCDGANATYDIEYEDGDSEKAVKEALVRVPPPQLSEYNVGDVVEGNYQGNGAWYGGKIKGKQGSGYEILYDDGEEERGVSVKNIRLIKAAMSTPSTAAPAPSSAVDESTAPISARKESSIVAPPAVLTTSPVVPLVAKFKVGDQVEGFYGESAWYSATVQAVRNEAGSKEVLYDLLYDDGDKEQSVKENCVRIKPPAAKDMEKKTATVSEPVSATMAAATTFKQGDKVQANYGGKGAWFDGHITAVNGDGANATYDIEYEDGDSEKAVKEALVRVPPPQLSEYNVGDMVEGNYQGNGAWYGGKIKGKQGSGYEILYDDGEEERGVPVKNIRLIKAATVPTPPTVASAPSSSGSASSSAKPAVPVLVPKFKVGDKIEGFYAETAWYPATIQKVKNGPGVKEVLYDLLFDDGDTELSVKESCVRVKAAPQKELSTPSSSSTQPSPSPRSTKFQKGDKVQANYGGKGAWFDGHITAVNGDGANATYDIEYEDGDSEKAVKEALVRVPPPQLSEYNVGDVVEGNYQGNGAWYGGKIKGKQGGGYEILYDDGEEERGVPVKNIRLIKAAVSAAPASTSVTTSSSANNQLERKHSMPTSTNLDSFLNDLSDDEDGDGGIGGLDGGPPIDLVKGGDNVVAEEDDYYEDFAA